MTGEPGSQGTQQPCMSPKAVKLDAKHLSDETHEGPVIAEANMISFRVDNGSDNHPVMRVLGNDTIYIDNLSNGVVSWFSSVIKGRSFKGLRGYGMYEDGG